MLKGLLGLRDEGGGGESGSGKVELAENKLILSQFYFTLFPFPSIQMDHNRFAFEIFFFHIIITTPKVNCQWSILD